VRSGSDEREGSANHVILSVAKDLLFRFAWLASTREGRVEGTQIPQIPQRTTKERQLFF
jgi:hypothetical protein